MNFNAVFVALADGGTLVAFYKALFGQELPGIRLGLFNPKATHRAEFVAPSSGGMSLCIEVENLDAAIAHLTHLGCPPPGDIQQASHGREIYAYDPCSNRLILHESRKDVLG
jgi:predicted enzyme related to lactoylglutathione lyase